MDKVRAKFRCHTVAKRQGFNGHPFVYDAQFGAVSGDSGENKQFFAATPAGSISLTSILPDAFEPGKDYYVDITPAE
jgi:hypothetical protein